MSGAPVCYLCGCVGQHEVQACPLRKWLLGSGLASAVAAVFLDASHMVTVASMGTLAVLMAPSIDPRVGIGFRDWPVWLQVWTLGLLAASAAQALDYCTGVTQ